MNGGLGAYKDNIEMIDIQGKIWYSDMKRVKKVVYAIRLGAYNERCWE